MAANEIGVAYLSIVPSAKNFGTLLSGQVSKPLAAAGLSGGTAAGKGVEQGLTKSTGGIGSVLKSNAILPILGIGVAAFASAKSVEDANNLIIRATGASGKAAEGLKKSFQNVAGQTPADFQTVATALTEVSQRTGLTGKSLEALTLQVVTFNRITKDSPLNVGELTKALASFNIPANKMGGTLDRLFKISQKTGVPLAELVSTLQTAGPVVRQFGFPIEQSAGLLAQLNKAGVDANPVIAGLRKAFVGFAKAGKDPAKSLREVVGQINDLVKVGDVAGARSLAIQIFGPRGTALADAALQGKLSLEDLSKTFDTTGDGIQDTASKTGTLSGKLGVLKNNAQLALAEFGTPLLESFTDILKAALPFLVGFAKAFKALPGPVKDVAAGLILFAIAAKPLGKVVRIFSALPGFIAGVGGALKGLAGIIAANPALLALGATVAVGAFVLAHEDEIRSFAGDRFAPKTDAAAKQLDQTAGNLKSTFEKAQETLFRTMADPKAGDAARAAAQANFDKVRLGIIDGNKKVIKAQEDIRDENQRAADNPVLFIFGTVFDNIASFLSPVTDAIGSFFGEIGDIVSASWHAVEDWTGNTWDFVTDFVFGAVQGIADFFVGIWQFITGVVSGAWDLITSVVGAAIGFLTSVITGGFNLVVGIIGGAWNFITAGAAAAWAFVSSIIGGAIGLVTGIFNGFRNVVFSVFGGISSFVQGVAGIVSGAIKGIVNTVLDGVNWIIRHLRGFEVPEVSIGPFHVGGGKPFEGLHEIPHLAKGGIVQSQTLALLAEVKPEVVAPLDSLLPMIEEAVRNALADPRAQAKTNVEIGLVPQLTTTTLPALNAEIHAHWILDTVPTLPTLDASVLASAAPASPAPSTRAEQPITVTFEPGAVQISAGGGNPAEIERAVLGLAPKISQALREQIDRDIRSEGTLVR